MKDFEQKFEQAANQEIENIHYPEFEKIAGSVSGVKQRNIRYFKIRAATVIMAGILVFLTLLGATFKNYIFGDNLPHLFQNAEDDGLVNIYDTKASDNDVTVALEAIFSDQIYTYVKIAADGSPLERINTRNTNDDYKGSWLAERIKQARLITEDGQSWSFRDQIVWSTPETTATTTPMLNSENLKKNESILMFYGAPEKDVMMNLEIEFYDIDTKVSFDNVQVKVPEIVIRDVSKQNLFLEVPYAKGQITQIKYTPIQTQFTVIWMIEDTEKLHQNYGFVTDYSMAFISEGKEARDMIFPRGNLESIDRTPLTYNIGEKFSPDKEIKIDLYKYNFEQQPNREFVETLLVIPPVTPD